MRPRCSPPKTSKQAPKPETIRNKNQTNGKKNCYINKVDTGRIYPHLFSGTIGKVPSSEYKVDIVDYFVIVNNNTVILVTLQEIRKEKKKKKKTRSVLRYFWFVSIFRDYLPSF